MGHVAVVMSVYRSDELKALKAAIESILNQSYTGVELFLYRDGPVPSELDTYLQETNALHQNVQYYEGECNQGLARSLNTLIEHVLMSGKFEFIARMDSDDISHLERIEQQVYFFENNPTIEVCGTLCREFGADFSLERKELPLAHSELLDFSIARCPFIHPTVMFRTSVFENQIRYPVDTTYTEDMALWFLLLDSGYKFANVNDVLLDYRLNEGTISRRKGLDKAMSEVRLRLKYMVKLRRISIKNSMLILSRLVFHLMPGKVVSLAYRYFR